MEYGVWSLEYGVDAAMWSGGTRKRVGTKIARRREAMRGERTPKKGRGDNKLDRHELDLPTRSFSIY